MLPVILGIAAKVAGTAISAWQAAAIGVGIGAVGTNLMKNNRNQSNGVIPEEDDELEELVELLKERRRRMKKKV